MTKESAKVEAQPQRREYLIRECMASAVRLAITRHNLELDPDAATEEEVAYDAAGACFGEECCDDKMIPELAELLEAGVAAVPPTPTERNVIAEKERLEIKTWIEQQRNDYQSLPEYGATSHDMFRVLKGRMEGYKHVLDYLYERDSIPEGLCRICFGKLEPHGQCSQCGEYPPRPTPTSDSPAPCLKIAKSYGTKIPDLCGLPLNHEGPCAPTPDERAAYAKMRTGFNALHLEVDPSIVNDLLKTFEEYVAVARASVSRGVPIQSQETAPKEKE